MKRGLLLILLLVAGCASPEQKVTPLTHERPPVVEQPVVEHPVAEQPVVKPPIEKPPTVAPPIFNEPAPFVPKPVPTWVSLTDWCAQHQLAPPLILTNATQTNITVQSPKGSFVFSPPRWNARWNDIYVGIGFPPQLTNHTILVHNIDVTKVLEPLLLTNTEPRKGGIIVIDAGHGGTNEGTISLDHKLREKDMTLDWAHRIEKLLQGTAWQVYLTRAGDQSIGLTQRVAFAESKKADIFISLHFNATAKTAESGLETYCLTPQGMASHLTRGYADEVDLHLPNNEFDIENLLLAERIHRSILHKTGRKDRGVRRARFMTVLRDQQRPAVLVEGGYLSNPDEARLIGSPQFRQKLAEAVVEALGVTPPGATSLQ